MAKARGQRRMKPGVAVGGPRHRRPVQRRAPATIATAAALGFAMWTSTGVASADESQEAIAEIWDRLPAEAQSALAGETTDQMIAAAAAEDAQTDALEAATDAARHQERAAEQAVQDAEQDAQMAEILAYQDSTIAQAMAIHNAAVAQGQADWEAQHNPPPPPAPAAPSAAPAPAPAASHTHEADPGPGPGPAEPVPQGQRTVPVAYEAASHSHWSPGMSTTAFASALANEYGLNLGSGYRTPEKNAAVGGAEKSDHMKGDPDNPGAWDIPCDTSNPNCDALADEASRSGVPQVLWRVADHYDHVHLGFGDPYV